MCMFLFVFQVVFKFLFLPLITYLLPHQVKIIYILPYMKRFQALIRLVKIAVRMCCSLPKVNLALANAFTTSFVFAEWLHHFIQITS